MIHRTREGERMHFGLNWDTCPRTYLELRLLWRGWTHGYVLGFRLRRPQYGHVFIPRMGRWLWAPKP